MDAIEPILPNPSILPEVRAAQRSAPVHRDGRGGSGAYGDPRRRRQREQQPVEVDVEGVEETDGIGQIDAPDGALGGLPVAHRIDLTAGDGSEDGAGPGGEPGARRIDV